MQKSATKKYERVGVVKSKDKALRHFKVDSVFKIYYCSLDLRVA